MKVRVLLATLVVTVGCSQAPRSPHQLIIALDESGSTRGVLNGYLNGAVHLAGRLDPKHSRLTVLSFANQTTELFDKARPRSLEKFHSEMVSKLKQLPSRPGTYFAPLLRSVATHLDRRLPVTVVLFTDAGSDDASAQAVHEAAAQLGGSPASTIYVVGAEKGNREKLRALCACPQLTLQFVDVSDLKNVLD